MATAPARTTRASAVRASLDDVKAQLRALIEEAAGIPAATIHDRSTIDDDLAMDSMSFVSLQVAVEETFGIRCDAEDLERRNRFDHIAAFVVEQMNAPADKPTAPRAASTAKKTRAKKPARARTPSRARKAHAPKAKTKRK